MLSQTPNSTVSVRYFNNTSGASVAEVGQIFCGQSFGLNLRTNTAHPIRFTTYNDEVVGVPASMQILGTGTRAVEILAPLNVKSSQTTFDNGRLIGSSMSAQAIGLYVSNNGIVGGNLTVVGNMSYKPYIAFRLSANAIAQNTGQYQLQTLP